MTRLWRSERRVEQPNLKFFYRRKRSQGRGCIQRNKNIKLQILLADFSGCNLLLTKWEAQDNEGFCSRGRTESLFSSLSSVRNSPRHAAGKRTTFFLPLMASAPFAAGKNVSSTYFLAQATRSRLQLRSSLRLIFSRWLSIVFTLR